MNKRLVKKMMKKKIQFEGVISADGNNGGDILEIHDNMDGTIRLRSGHCCITSIDKVVPIEFLTSIISKVMLENNNDVRQVIDSFDWAESFNEELKKKVR